MPKPVQHGRSDSLDDTLIHHLRDDDNDHDDHDNRSPSLLAPVNGGMRSRESATPTPDSSAASSSGGGLAAADAAAPAWARREGAAYVASGLSSVDAEELAVEERLLGHDKAIALRRLRRSLGGGGANGAGSGGVSE